MLKFTQPLRLKHIILRPHSTLVQQTYWNIDCLTGKASTMQCPPPTEDGWQRFQKVTKAATLMETNTLLRGHFKLPFQPCNIWLRSGVEINTFWCAGANTFSLHESTRVFLLYVCGIVWPTFQCNYSAVVDQHLSPLWKRMSTPTLQKRKVKKQTSVCSVLLRPQAFIW